MVPVRRMRWREFVAQLRSAILGGFPRAGLPTEPCDWYGQAASMGYPAKVRAASGGRKLTAGRHHYGVCLDGILRQILFMKFTMDTESQSNFWTLTTALSCPIHSR